MRKEDKLRPYRVDYFNIDEMKEVDQALVCSVVVRAVTAAEAAGKVLTDNETLPIILIRSHRFYGKLGAHKKGVYKAVEDLFNAKQALIVMGEVEKYRASQALPAVGAIINLSVVPQPIVLGARETGPTSPATVAVVADLNGMLAHDAHEQTMDTFVPSSIPDGKRVPDVTNTLPVEPLIEPDQAVGPAGRPRVPHWAGCACAVCNKVEAYPLWAKITVFGGVLLLVVKLVMFLLHR